MKWTHQRRMYEFHSLEVAKHIKYSCVIWGAALVGIHEAQQRRDVHKNQKNDYQLGGEGVMTGKQQVFL